MTPPSRSANGKFDCLPSIDPVEEELMAAKNTYFMREYFSCYDKEENDVARNKSHVVTNTSQHIIVYFKQPKKDLIDYSHTPGRHNQIHKIRENMSKFPQRCLHIVPGEFFCPISQEFMKDPVIAPSTKRTYNWKSFVALREGTLRINGGSDILPPENESVLPNHNLRQMIVAWHHNYKLALPFSFILRPTDLEVTVHVLLDR